MSTAAERLRAALAAPAPEGWGRESVQVGRRDLEELLGMLQLAPAPPPPEVMWWNSTRVGDELTPIGLWNETTWNKAMRLPNKCKVLSIERGSHSESGVSFKVRTNGDGTINLDAGWFLRPARN